MPRKVVDIDQETEEAAFAAVRELVPQYKPKSLQELIVEHRADINAALTNHCSYEEIAACLKQFKVEITPSTLKRYHRSGGTKARAKQVLAKQKKGAEAKPSARLSSSKGEKEKEKGADVATEFSTY